MPLPTGPRRNNPELPENQGGEREPFQSGKPELPRMPITDVPKASAEMKSSPIERKLSENFGISKEAEKISEKYVSIGSLTADQLINGTYDQFSHLEKKIEETVKYVQDVMTEQNQTDKLVEARLDRTVKYVEMVAFLDRLILKYIASEKIIRGEDRKILVASVINEILGLGPIEPLWSDPNISEIMVNGPNRVRAEVGGKLIDVPGARFRDKDHLLSICQQILGARGRRVDISNPLEDGRLADGSRVNVVHYAVAPSGPFLTIRRFPEAFFDIKTLVNYDSMTKEMAEEIGNLVYSGCSTVVVGGTGTGKTTFLNALSGCIPLAERIITIEDSLELQLHPARDVSSMESRPSSAAGTGEVSIRKLVRNALRMRPDRLIVGEVRDASAYDMLQAMNTGHDGSMTTVHANDAEGAVDRLVNLVTESGGMSPERAMSLVAGGVDIFVVIDRFPEDGSRRVVGIYEVPNRVSMLDGAMRLDPIPLWEFVTDGFDENDKVIGHYEKINDLSSSIRRKKRLDRKKRLVIDEIYAMSSVNASLSDLIALENNESIAPKVVKEVPELSVDQKPIELNVESPDNQEESESPVSDDSFEEDKFSNVPLEESFVMVEVGEESNDVEIEDEILEDILEQEENNIDEEQEETDREDPIPFA